MFVRKITTFLVLLFLVLLGSLFVNKVVLGHLYKTESSLPDEAIWLAIGDSHIANSINPQNYPWLVNRAHSGERLLYNFEKIKFYLENNPQVDLVILGYWYNTMDYNLDWVLHGKDMRYRYESYMPLMLYNNSDVDYLNVRENKKLFLENYWGYKIGYTSPAVKIMVKNYFTLNQNLEMKGGFVAKRNRYEATHTHPKQDTSVLLLDSLAVVNLREVVRFLDEKKVKLVLYNPPMHSSYLRAYNYRKIEMIDSIALSYVNDSNVWYINHAEYHIPNEYFSDQHHLNLDGANYITPILVDAIIELTEERLD